MIVRQPLGSIRIETDPNIAIMEFYQGHVVCWVGDVLQPLQVNDFRKNFIPLPLLEPSYMALSYLIDGNNNAFQQFYVSQLISQESFSTILVLLACMKQGKHIVLYIEDREISNLEWVPMLHEFIMNTFGVYIGIDDSFCYINEDLWGRVLIYLYTYIDNVVTVDELLLAKDWSLMTPEILQKMSIESKKSVEQLVDIHNNIPNFLEGDVINLIRRKW